MLKKDLIAKVKQLEKQNADLVAKNKKLTAPKSQRSSKKTEDLGKELTATRTKLKSLQNKCSVLESKLNTANRQKNSVSDELAKAKAEAKRLHAVIDDYERSMQVFKGNREVAEKRLEVLKQNIIDFSSKSRIMRWASSENVKAELLQNVGE